MQVKRDRINSGRPLLPTTVEITNSGGRLAPVPALVGGRAALYLRWSRLGLAPANQRSMDRVILSTCTDSEAYIINSDGFPELTN